MITARYIIMILIISISFFSFNCSYIVDSIEAIITDRSSFSIEGSCQSGIVTISWEKGAAGSGDEAFAGYEIYITEEPDNEFVGYEVLYAPYDLGLGNDDSILRRTSTTEHSFDAAAQGFDGVYFFRVGIIEWDKETKEERSGTDDDDPGTTGWIPYNLFYSFEEYDDSNYDEYDDNQWFYINKTNLSSISGSVMIDIKP